MTYEEALNAIKQGPAKAARRRSWDDGEACVWWDGRQINHSRFKSRGVGWTLTRQDKSATDWITDELDWGAQARRLVMTDEPEEIARLEKLLECSRDEVVNQFIEEPAWASLVPGKRPGFPGGALRGGRPESGCQCDGLVVPRCSISSGAALPAVDPVAGPSGGTRQGDSSARARGAPGPSGPAADAPRTPGSRPPTAAG